MEICDLAKALDAFYEIGKERKECNALVQCLRLDCHMHSISAHYISVHQKFINKQQPC